MSVVDYTDSRATLNSLKADQEREGITVPNEDAQSMRFLQVNTVPERLDKAQEFLKRIPQGKIKLTRQQRDKLIQILNSHYNEDEDIILTLNNEQTEGLVRTNIGVPGTMVSVQSPYNQEAIENNEFIRLYPKDFYPLIERKELAGSSLYEYPKDGFDIVDRVPLMMRKPVLETGHKRVKKYPKDLLELADEAFDKKEISVYPQELLDLLKDIGDNPNDPELREKVDEYFPEEMIDLVRSQPGRQQFVENTLYPEEIFELGDQEKLTGERVSFFAQELLSLINDEAQKEDTVLFPEKLSEDLSQKYNTIIHLNPEQRKDAIRLLSQKGNGQVVITPDQKQDLLQTLETHQQLEREALNEMHIDPEDSEIAINEDLVGPCEVGLSPDQVLDVLNQNCLVFGIPIEPTEAQLKGLERVAGPTPILQGADYYDSSDDRIVDFKGQNVCLGDLNRKDRKKILHQLDGKKFHAVVTGKEGLPRVLEETYYDPSLDTLIDVRNGDKISVRDLGNRDRLGKLQKLDKKNLKPLKSAIPKEAYYDSMVDELVDIEGDRHALKDLTLNEVEDLVSENMAEEVPVVVQPDGRRAFVLENVWYLPIEDCLVDQKNRKTILTDLTPDERLSLMEALGNKKGIDISSQPKSKDGKKKNNRLLDSQKEKELDKVMEKMSESEANKKALSWKKNYSNKSKSGHKDPKKTVKIISQSRSKGDTSSFEESRKSKKKSRIKKNKPKTSSVKEDFLNTVKSNRKKKKGENKKIESVVVTNLRNSYKNPLYNKIISEEESFRKSQKNKNKKSKNKKSKKNKVKKKKKPTSVKSGDLSKVKDSPKKESKEVMSEPNNFLNKDHEAIDNEMGTFVDGSIDDDSFRGDYEDSKKDILEDVINELKEENEDGRNSDVNELPSEEENHPSIEEVEEGHPTDEDPEIENSFNEEIEEKVPNNEEIEKGYTTDEDPEKEYHTNGDPVEEYNTSRDPVEEYHTNRDSKEEYHTNQDPEEEDINKNDQSSYREINLNPSDSEFIEAEDYDHSGDPEKSDNFDENPPSKNNEEDLEYYDTFKADHGNLKPKNNHSNPEVRDSEVKYESEEEESIKQESVKEESVKEESVKEETVKEETVKEESVDNEFVDDADSERDETFHHDQAIPQLIHDDDLTEKTVPKVNKKTFTNEVIAHELETNTNYGSSRQEFSQRSNEPVLIDEQGRVSGIKNRKLRTKIEMMFTQEKQKLSTNIIRRCESMIKKRVNTGMVPQNETSEDDNMMEEFYEFCQKKLPLDPKYKESMLFVSLFYYFLEKKGMLKERSPRL